MTTRTLSVPQMRTLLAAAYGGKPLLRSIDEGGAVQTRESLKRRGLIDETGTITPAGKEALRTLRIAA